MISTTRTPGALTVGPLRPVILKLAAPAVAMMACHFCFNLIDAMWVGPLIGPAALAAVSTAGFYVWVLLSLGEMVEVGLIAVAARRHGEGLPQAAAGAAAAAVLYALAAGAAVSLVGFAVTGGLFRLMGVPPDVARRPDDPQGRRAAVAFGRAAVGDLHVAHPLHGTLRYPRPGCPRRGAQGGRARFHRDLGFRPLGERACRTEPGRPPGMARPGGRADDRALLPPRHVGDRDRVPRDPRAPGRAIHHRPRGHRGREPVPAGDRLRSDRADVRDHSRGSARRRRVYLLAAGRKHVANRAARAARGVVVRDVGPAWDLDRPEPDRGRPGGRDDAVLGLRHVAARGRMREKPQAVSRKPQGASRKTARSRRATCDV